MKDDEWRPKQNFAHILEFSISKCQMFENQNIVKKLMSCCCINRWCM